MRGKFIGMFLILAGGLLLMRELNWPYSEQLLSLETFIIATGLMAILLSKRPKAHPNLLIWGCILTGLGIHLWGLSHVDGWPEHWSILPAIVGASYLVHGILKKDRRNGWIGVLLLMLGMFAWPGVERIPGLATVGKELNTYWPALMILLGLMLLFKK